MGIFENFSTLFVEVWKKGILGVDIFQILVGLGIFLIFLLFRGFISKIIINRLKKIAKKTTNRLDDTFVQAMEGPARFFPIVIGFFIASYYLDFSPESQSFIANVNQSLITILIFWLIHQFIQPVSYLLGGLEKLLTKELIGWIVKALKILIFIYSSKSAKNLFNLINKYSLLNVVTQSNLMCISEKVLLILKQIKWKKVFVFSPGEEEFLLNKIR